MEKLARWGGSRLIREMVADAMAGFDERRERGAEKNRRKNAPAKANAERRQQLAAMRAQPPPGYGGQAATAAFARGATAPQATTAR